VAAPTLSLTNNAPGIYPQHVLVRIARSRVSVWLVLSGFLALGVLSSFRIPLFQGADESWHYAYVEHYALGRPLPNLNLHFTTGDPSAPYWQSHEASQPPLYYMLMSTITTLIPRGNLMREVILEGSTSNGMNGNLLPADTGGLGSGHVLAARLVRLATVLLGVIVVACAYATTLLATQRAELALLVAAMTAFNPRIIVLSAAVSNDMAVSAAASLTLLLVTYYVMSARRPHAALAGLMGVGAGVSLLMKYSGGVIIVAAVAALACRAWRDRASWRTLLAYGLAFGAGALLVTGWYFLHDWQLYGDILAWNKVNEMNAGLAAPRPVQESLNLIPFILSSFFGHPGYVLQVAVDHNLWMLRGFVVAAVGVVILAVRRRLNLAFVPLLVALAANVVAYYTWLTARDATQNMRFFSPMFVPITMLYVLGILAFFPRRWYAGLAVFASLAYALFIGTTLYESQRQMYAYPSYVREPERDAVLGRSRDGRVMFENGIQLIDAHLERQRQQSGEPIKLSVIWQVTRPLTEPAQLMLDVRDSNDQTITAYNTGNVDRYSHVVRAWQVGQLVREDYEFTPNVAQTDVLRILAGWYRQKTRTPIRPVGNGSVSVELGRVKVSAGQLPPTTDAATTVARVDGLGNLVGVKITEDDVVLDWQATAEPAGNYTLFVHGLDADGKIVAQQDQPFAHSVAYWTRGERLIERIHVPGLAQARSVRIGVYDPATLQRLHAVHPDGSAWPDDAIVVPIQPGIGQHAQRPQL